MNIKDVKLRYKIGLGAAAVATAVVGGGAAFAYFTGTGSNTSGAGSVGSSAAWTVNTPSAAGSTALYPGVGSQTFAFVVTNAGGGNQLLSKVVATVNPTISGCLASWYTVQLDTGTAAATTATETYTNNDIAKAGTQSVSATLALTDAPANQNVCQGDTPTVTLAAS